MAGGSAASLRLNDRMADRHRLKIETTLRQPDGPEMRCRIDNISSLGFSGVVAHRLQVPCNVIVHIPTLGDVAARIVWVRDGLIGGEFFRAIDVDAMVRALKTC